MHAKNSVRLAAIALAFAIALVPLLLLATRVLPYDVYVVHTGSMSPTIPSKSAVIVREGEYRVGQVISYHTASGIVTHRLIGAAGDGLLRTKGDANRTADPSTISASQVIGGVVAAPRMVGYWIIYFKQPAGLASLFLAVICAWLVYSLPSDVAALKPRRRPEPARRPSTPLRPPTTQPGRSAPLAERLPAMTTPQREPVPEGMLVFRCSGCGATFPSGDELRAHLVQFGPPKPRQTRTARRHGIPVEFLPRTPWQRAT
jgi:signal peptidase